MTRQRRSVTAAGVRRLLQQPQVFGHRVDLRNVVVNERLDLRGETLCGCDFSGSEFTQAVDFSGAVFRGLSWFRDVCFVGPAVFARARFHNDARFDGAIFRESADFSYCGFRGIAGFDHLQADKGFRLDNITAFGNVSLGAATLAGITRFDGAEIIGGLWSPGARIDQVKGMETADIYGRIVLP